MLSNPSSPQMAASWRKPGQKLRQRVLDQDRAASETSSIQILEDCSITRYYDVCDKVLDEFLQHSIDSKAEMVESYVLGHRLVRLLSTLLRHRDYYSPEAEATQARAKSQEQLIKVLRYLDQLAILIDKEEHSKFIGTVIRKSSESCTSSEEQVSSNASTLEDLMEMQLAQSTFKIKVSKSSTQSTEEDLGFSMILAAESDRSATSANNDSYAMEIKDTSWLTNSIIAQDESDAEVFMAPNPLVRTERTIVTQDSSLEKSLEEEQVCFPVTLASHPERTSPNGESTRSKKSASKLENHFRVYPKVNNTSYKDPSVGYVSSTSSECQMQPFKSEPESVMDEISLKSCNSDEDANDAVNTTMDSFEAARQANLSNDYKATTYRDDTVTAAQISMTDSLGFPTSNLNVSQQAFDTIQKASLQSSSERSRSFTVLNSSYEDLGMFSAEDAVPQERGCFDSFHSKLSSTKSGENVRDIDRSADQSCQHQSLDSIQSSRKSEHRSEKLGHSFESNPESSHSSKVHNTSTTFNQSSVKIVGCSFVDTPKKSKNRTGLLDISTSTTQSSRSHRIYSCSTVKPEDYEILSLSPNPSVEFSLRTQSEQISPGTSIHRLRDIKQDFSKHESFRSSRKSPDIKPRTLCSRTDFDGQPNREESSVSSPSSSARSISRSPNCIITLHSKSTEAKRANEEDSFSAFPETSKSDEDDPFSQATWSPNDYFSQFDSNGHDDRINESQTPSWTAWSAEEEAAFKSDTRSSEIESHEEYYSDPAWFELEDHATARAIDITPSDSFELHQQRSVSLEESRQSPQAGFTKVSKSLSPICETSTTTNSLSYAKSRESISWYGSRSSFGNKHIPSEDIPLCRQHHGTAATKMCALDPRGLVLCNSRRRRHQGPVDLDDTIDEGFRCGRSLLR